MTDDEQQQQLLKLVENMNRNLTIIASEYEYERIMREGRTIAEMAIHKMESARLEERLAAIARRQPPRKRSFWRDIFGV